MNYLALIGGWRAAAFLALAIAASVWGGVQTARLSTAQHKATTTELALAISAKKHVEWVREQEAKKADEIAAIDTKHTEESVRAKESYDASIASIRAGERKLRERFSCPRNPSATPSAPGESDGATQGGLQREDGEFFVSEAERADEVVRQLTEAQAVIEAYRKQK